MVNKFEAIGIAVSIGAMVLALYLVRVETTTHSFTVSEPETQSASVYVAGDGTNPTAVAGALEDAADDFGNIEKLVIDDVVLGTGTGIVEGDVVTVHYIGSLQNGQQFDNTYLKGTPFSFEVGKNRVIAGWEQGILGMKVGGQRILVIPSELAYGVDDFGPIPGGATLVFAIELLSIE
ncbi:FKBP-type peptidyl-prolyl cis-trans isomerase [Candidatus Pacebacteria bacterium]|nr:FKBP-type peptidyl-prolyl cis-trans isomerase [Candidatus Paceibacterota bacterium]